MAGTVKPMKTKKPKHSRPDADWRQQYARLERSFQRLLAPHKSSVDYEDDAYHFFQDCWHLKDWIANSTRVGKSIEDELKHYAPLMIAADVANGSKHLMLDLHPDRPGATVASKSVTAHLGQDLPADIIIEIAVDANSTMRAEQVARDSMAAWEAVIKTLGL